MRDSPSIGRSSNSTRTGLVAQGAAEQLTSVLLPEPLGPIRPSRSPRAIVEIDAVERDKAAEPLAETADLEDRALGIRRVGHVAHEACARARRRLAINPMIPFGTTMTKPISNRPTISRLTADEIVTVATSWIVPSNTEPNSGPIQLFMPPTTGIATLLTA